MPGKGVAFAVKTGSDSVLITVVAALSGNFTAQGFFQLAVRDAAGVDIDDPADRTIAVEQGGRSFQHFDAVSDERFHGSRVVSTGHRHIHGAETILHNQNASASQPVNDRAANRGAKTGGVDARLHGQRITKIRSQASGQIVASERDSALGEALRRQRVGTNNDFLNGVF